MGSEDPRQFRAVIGVEPRQRRNIREVTSVLISVRWKIPSIAVFTSAATGQLMMFFALSSATRPGPSGVKETKPTPSFVLLSMINGFKACRFGVFLSSP